MDRRLLLSTGLLLVLAPLLACSGTTTIGVGVNQPPPTISSQPMSQTVNLGATVTFTVTASGTSLTFQWQENGVNISGATSASFTTPPTTAADNGATFRVIVSNPAGSVTSSSATLTVNGVAPAITTPPANQTVNAGATATFSVTAAGSPPLSYQWQKNGANISGATSAGYTTPVTTTADSGEMFQVIVSNAFGNKTSTAATLTVNAMTAAGTDVTMYKNDRARTGQNLTETTLTTTNVKSATFGLKHNLMVTGKVDAQPLYLSQFSIGGAAHNVVYVATEHDVVYAFDSDSGTPIWSQALTAAGETPSDDRGCNQVSPEIGVTATPAIDRKAGPNGAIFVVAMSKDGSANYHQRLHALDLTTGSELFGGPKEVQATFPNLSGTTTFDPAQYKERPGLVLLNGVIYTSWSSHCDFTPYTGWIIGYNETTLAQTSVLNIAPNSNGGGPSIWMSGGAPAADSSGNLYMLAGNGVFEVTLNANGFPSSGDYGNAFVKISTAGNVLAVADYWTMFNEVAESSTDTDLGSGGAMLLPDLMDSGGTVHHLAVGAGKDSNLYVVDRDKMGHFNAASNNIWQEIDGVLPGGIFATPAYFQNTVYCGDFGGTLKAFTITNAKLSTTPAAQSANSFPYPGTAPAVSANGNTNGIIWAAENSAPVVLHAYDAASLVELYNSNQAGTRDQCGSGNKFITPTIADGKVFLATQNSVCVFGLLP